MKKIVLYTCEVIADEWGTYKKGDRLKIEGTTARACAKGGMIKICKDKKPEDVTGKKEQKGRKESE